MIKLITRDTFFNTEFPKNYEADFVVNYVYPFIQAESQTFIKNLKTEVMLVQVGEHLLPITKNETEYENSYVCSPYTHYISYAKAELDIMKMPFLKILTSPLFALLGCVGKMSKMNKVIIVNNYMLSTNLYPQISADKYSQIISFLKGLFPDYLIMFRSLNENLNRREIELLESFDCRKITSRRLYVLKKEYMNSKNKGIVKKDERLFKNKGYSLRKAEKEDVTQIKYLYDKLYLDKYSKLNPEFTQAFYTNILKQGLFNICILEKNGESLGVYGIFKKDNAATAPIFGYETSLQPAEGLYRCLSLWGFDYIAETPDININYSSGVGNFKRSRGAKGFSEYSLIYFNHLPLYRQLFWESLIFLMNKITLPIMIRNKV